MNHGACTDVGTTCRCLVLFHHLHLGLNLCSQAWGQVPLPSDPWCGFYQHRLGLHVLELQRNSPLPQRSFTVPAACCLLPLSPHLQIHSSPEGPLHPLQSQALLAWCPCLFTSPDEVTTRATGQTDLSRGSHRWPTVCITAKPFSKVALHFSSPKALPICVAAHMGISGTGLSSSGPGGSRPGNMRK